MAPVLLTTGFMAALAITAPWILENLHRLYVPFTVMALLFFCLNSAAPYSWEARNIHLWCIRFREP